MKKVKITIQGRKDIELEFENDEDILMYISLNDNQIAETMEISGEVNADFDEKGKLIGVEIY